MESNERGWDLSEAHQNSIDDDLILGGLQFINCLHTNRSE